MDIRRSCCSSSVCCGMPVEKGCFIFAIINATIMLFIFLVLWHGDQNRMFCVLYHKCGMYYKVICSFATLGSLMYFLIFMPWFNGSSLDPMGDGVLIMYMVLRLACCLASGIALTFAVVLCIGIQTNNKSYLMAYLIYGTITLTLTLMGTVGLIWCGVGLTKYALIAIGICVLYTGMLVLVYQTIEVIAESERTPHAYGSSL